MCFNDNIRIFKAISTKNRMAKIGNFIREYFWWFPTVNWRFCQKSRKCQISEISTGDIFWWFPTVNWRFWSGNIFWWFPLKTLELRKIHFLDYSLILHRIMVEWIFLDTIWPARHYCGFSLTSQEGLPYHLFFRMFFLVRIIFWPTKWVPKIGNLSSLR